MKAFVKYGLGTGVLSGIWTTGAFTVVGWLDRTFWNGALPAAHIRSYSGLFSILLLAIGIWLGMKETRRRNGNTLTYGQAVKTGVLISFITAVMVAFFGFLYCTVINPGYAEFMVKDAERTLLAAGKTTQEIGLRLESERKEFSTPVQVLMALVGQSVVGTILSLILGAFTRTKK